MTWFLFQVERAPTTDRVHCQVVFYGPVRAFSGVVTRWSPVGHVELARGSVDDNVKYCSKEESRVIGPFEFGSRPSQGKRKDLSDVREIVKSGGGMAGVIEAASSYQSLRAAELFLKYCERVRDFMPEVYWWYGSTEAGKTRAAFAEFADEKREGERLWVSGKTLEWWEGYDAHEWVIIDDFRRDYCKFHELLRMFDRYPYRVMNKGGSRQLLARVMIVTCPWSPSQLYSVSHSSEDLGQLTRRLSSVKLWGDEVPDPVVPNPVPHFRSAK